MASTSRLFARSRAGLLCALLAAGASGCSQGQIGGETSSGVTPNPGGNPGTAGTAGTGGDPGANVRPIPTDPAFLPPRVRRLSNAEYEKTIGVVLGLPAGAMATSLPVDFRQNDFTQNAAQQVDSTYATQLQTAAQGLATSGLARLMGLAGCAASGGEACARQFISNVGQQFYRRPLTDLEKGGLLKVFQAGATGGTFEEGMEGVVTALLESPNFLYVTELGAGAPGADGVVKLTEYEIASALSFLFTGGPPDAELMAAAAGGKLAGAAEREAHARRLLMTTDARAQVQRFVKEWLGLDRLANTGKDPQLYPMFTQLRPLMTAEADAFIKEVVFNDDATVAKLLTADYTLVEGPLAQFYGLPQSGANQRVPYGAVPRRGILMQGAFLSVYGHDHESAPIKRGATILSKVLCSPLPLPGELSLMIVPPPPDPNKTTRERFAQHSSDNACRACHALLDPFGFSLENMDAMGGLRTMENGKPVDTKATLDAVGVTGAVNDGSDMVALLAANDTTKECFARNMFRFAAAQSGQGYEELFLRNVWDKMAATQKFDLKEAMVALAASDIFVSRREP